MAAIYNNLYLEQGATYNTNIVIKGDYNLTGTGNSQIRSSYYSANSAASFNVTIDAANSIINLSMTPDVTANIPAGRYVYDTIISDSANNITTRILEGVISVSPSVTR
jgi:hypothetical protein